IDEEFIEELFVSSRCGQMHIVNHDQPNRQWLRHARTAIGDRQSACGFVGQLDGFQIIAHEIGQRSESVLSSSLSPGGRSGAAMVSLPEELPSLAPATP